MAVRPGIEIDAIELARKSLVELTLTHTTSAKVARKRAVKELFGTLLASWESGVPFDKMAEALTANGVDITTETLRSYFFELKTDAQLKSENAEHERAMARLRQERAASQRAKDLEHARSITLAGTDLMSTGHEASVAAATQLATKTVESARRRAGSAAVNSTSQTGGKPLESAHRAPPSTRAQRNTPPAVASFVPPATELLKEQLEASTDRIDGETPGSAKNNTDAPPGVVEKGIARTLDELAKISQGQQETPITENLVLREGNTVFRESGQPFEGYLSPRTLHTLRTVGKVIAPTVGRTAKDFVPMSHEL